MKWGRKDEIFFISLLIGLVTACGAPRYTATPLKETYSDIVIVKDNETKAGFLDTMETWLGKKGYNYSVVKEGAARDHDKLVLEYEGKWGWDLALYLKRAYIKAFDGNSKVGSVNFDVPYTANPAKFGKGETRINYMMDVLFGEMTAEEATKTVSSSKKKK